MEFSGSREDDLQNTSIALVPNCDDKFTQCLHRMDEQYNSKAGDLTHLAVRGHATNSKRTSVVVLREYFDKNKLTICWRWYTVWFWTRLQSSYILEVICPPKKGE